MKDWGDDARGMLRGIGVAGSRENDHHPDEDGEPIENEGTDFEHDVWMPRAALNIKQAPGTRETPKSKSQIPSSKPRAVFKVWSLGFYWVLGFGFWGFP